MNALQRRRRAVTHYDELARISKALSSPVRLRLLDLLRQGPRGVETLAFEAQESVANTSQHLQHMLQARLVEREKAAQRVEYRIADAAVSLLFSALREVAEVLLPELDRLRSELDVQNEAEREQILSLIRARRVSLIDVRPVEEYRAGHLPGALSIPLAELPQRIPELPRSTELVAYCRGPYCPLALEAVAILQGAGLKARHLDLGPPDLVGRRGLTSTQREESGRDRSAARTKLTVVDGTKKKAGSKKS